MILGSLPMYILLQNGDRKPLKVQ